MLSRCVWSAALAAGVFLAGTAAQGAVNLEFRPATQLARANDTISVGLYAVYTGSGNTNISAMDVLLQWDPSKLQLLGNVNDGPYSWLQSNFPPDSGLDGLNNTFADGNAKYTALAQFFSTAQATPAGLLVTTFQFKALAATPGTTISIPLTLGANSRTAVYGNAFPGEDITGTRGTAGVSVCAGPANGDMNSSGATNGDDIQAFVAALSVSSALVADVCPGDFNNNHVIDTGDVPGMVAALLGT